MIVGTVQELEARIPLNLRGPKGHEILVDAVVDTGFTGSLMLSSAMIQGLELQWHSFGRGLLADGSDNIYDVYEGEVEWDGRWIHILIDETGTAPVVGMSMMAGYSLQLEVSEGGTVKLQSLS